MFGLLKKKNPYEQNGRDVYGVLADHIRSSAFYTAYGVPDTFDGRFDLLLVHMFMVMEVARDKHTDWALFNQALFDWSFDDMAEILREMGIGDMGIPKHMRKMMKAFNGRMHVYAEVLEQGGDLAEGLEGVLRRNLYGTVKDDALDNVKVEAFAEYMQQSLANLETKSFADIIGGEMLFKIKG